VLESLIPVLLSRIVSQSVKALRRVGRTSYRGSIMRSVFVLIERRGGS